MERYDYESERPAVRAAREEGGLCPGRGVGGREGGEEHRGP